MLNNNGNIFNKNTNNNDKETLTRIITAKTKLQEHERTTIIQATIGKERTTMKRRQKRKSIN